MSIVLTADGGILDVVNPGRAPSLRQELALRWAQQCCSVAGCDRTVNIQYDHRLEFADNPETVASNLDQLCERHHFLKTHRGWRLEPGTGRRRILAPEKQPPARPPGKPPNGPDTR